VNSEKGAIKMRTNEELVRAIRSGRDRNGALMMQLYSQNLPLIRQAARPFSSSVEMDDLLQQAYIGLSAAVDHWKPGNASFITYALYWIRNGYFEYLENCGGSCVRIPRNQLQKLGHFHAAVDTFTKEHGRKPAAAELAAMMGITLAEVEQLRTLDRIRKPGSLDAPLPGLEDSTETLSDAIPDPSRPFDDLDEEMSMEQIKSELRASVGRLDSIQRELIRLRFVQRLTFRECAARLDISEHRAISYTYKALRELSNSRRLQEMVLEDGSIYNAALQGTGFHAYNRSWTSATERVALAGL